MDQRDSVRKTPTLGRKVSSSYTMAHDPLWDNARERHHHHAGRRTVEGNYTGPDRELCPGEERRKSVIRRGVADRTAVGFRRTRSRPTWGDPAVPRQEFPGLERLEHGSDQQTFDRLSNRRRRTRLERPHGSDLHGDIAQPFRLGIPILP